MEHLNSFSLQKRRLRGDLIETFKIIKGIDKVDADKFFRKSSSVTRGHSQKLYKLPFKSDLRKYSFSQRVIDDWNRLPGELVEVSTVNEFKTRLDRHFNSEGIR